MLSSSPAPYGAFPGQLRPSLCVLVLAALVAAPPRAFAQPSGPGLPPLEQGGTTADPGPPPTPQSDDPTSAPERGLGFELQSDSATYQRFVAEAVAEHSAGRWAEARALFLRAHELEPSARTLRALGMTAFELREYPDAVRELSASLSHPRSPLSAVQRRRVLSLLERANAFVGRYRVELVPSHARLELNGLQVALESDGSVLLPLGRQLLSAHATGYQTVQQTVAVSGSDGQTLNFRLEPLWWARGTLPPLLMEPTSEAGTPLPSSWQSRLDPAAHSSAGLRASIPEQPAVAPIVRATQAPRLSPSWHLHDHAWTWASGASAVGLAGTSLGLWLSYRDERDSRANDARAQLTSMALGASLALAASTTLIYVLEARVVKNSQKELPARR